MAAPGRIELLWRTLAAWAGQPPSFGEIAPAGGRSLARFGVWLAVFFAAASVVPFALLHVDDVDGAAYQVIARHVAQDGRLLPLRFLPDFWPRFLEHPPLYFWIQALVIRLGSEALLPWLGAAIALATAGTAYCAGRATVGVRAALFGAFLLAATEEFFRYEARPRLDPPLALAYTLSVTLLLLARGRTAWLLAGGLAAGLGSLVKGPPALGAPVSAALALVLLGRGDELRRARAWLLAGAATLLPPMAFLLADRFALGGSWWRGYVQDQFLASLTGARSDGATSHGYLLGQVVSRFWPGLPFLGWALFEAARSPRAQRSRAVFALVAWAAVILGGYSIAGRALSGYILPALIPLALAAGAGLESALLRFFGERGARRGVMALVALSAMGSAALLAVPSRWLVDPCPFGDLPARAGRYLGPEAAIRLYASPSRSYTDLRAQAGWIAQHSGRDVTVAGDAPVGVGIFEEPAPGIPSGWMYLARHGRWALALKKGPEPNPVP